MCYPDRAKNKMFFALLFLAEVCYNIPKEECVALRRARSADTALHSGEKSA